MPLAMINVRLDAALKERVDPKLQQLGYSATQAIAALYQYIDQNDSLPFTIETRVYWPEESLQNRWTVCCLPAPGSRRSADC
ncbi:type II toxin-antitoxin system RelB/DinJ family antitoxin [Citrobacter sp. Cpo090]|uniref:type II toxin-antitoxin system RelB/DinJ family antitoxin n=1 Tax=Citrobacter TaxID=544 RepID=UPI0025754603|nr:MULTISPECIES: type II toxin-antitoxin system RelB/DinJ family antitoxin [Citrobacter]MDM2842278.1 type II toxin-antitoxin system RelB/DinJ family antitoxin [Citrobacter sp. Cpo090]MEB0967980.1 type II toxin-antitoxin system RelB/DinJ family antitoxin [Citrobacter braakii]